MIAGNFEDKYNSKNPLSKILVKNFLFTFKKILQHAGSSERIIELGAGEGYLTKIVSDYSFKRKTAGVARG